jgi:multiple sugar transport system substrate-binding protein
MKANKYFFIVALTTILLLLIIYFLIPFDLDNNRSQKEVVISYADNISTAHQMVINKFNEEYKGRIKVKPIDLPFTKFSTNERKELLARSLRSKSDKLDVFSIDHIWSARFVRWAENLNDHMNTDELNRILPSALNSCYYKDKLVALPIYADIGMMYYRKDLIRALPNSEEIEKKLKESITWEDFIILSRKFNLNKNPFYLFPADNFEGLVCSFMEILLSQNTAFFENDLIDWQSNEIKYTLRLLSDLIHRYKITPIEVTNYKDNTCYDYFIKNDGVFLRGWPSFTKDYKNLLKSNKIDTLLESAALPHIKNSKPHSVIGGWNIMVSKYSENKDEAIEFVKFILREESQKILYEYGAYLPILNEIYKDEEFLLEHPELTYNKKLLDNGIHRPLLENYTKISDVISYYTNQVLQGNILIETALENTKKSLISGELIVR